MKLKIKQNILMEHLNYVIKGISSKNLIPILQYIYCNYFVDIILSRYLSLFI